MDRSQHRKLRKQIAILYARISDEQDPLLIRALEQKLNEVKKELHKIDEKSKQDDTRLASIKEKDRNKWKDKWIDERPAPKVEPIGKVNRDQRRRMIEQLYHTNFESMDNETLSIICDAIIRAERNKAK